MELNIRPMRAAEFEVYRRRRIDEYAAAQVKAGNWKPEEAQELAAQASQRSLPTSLKTGAALFFVGERTDGTVVGFVWLALEHEEPGGAWLNSIEVLPEHRGRGYGRAMLAAAEQELRRRGIAQVGLSVFGSNEAGRQLYETSGYETVAIRMRKVLGPAR